MWRICRSVARRPSFGVAGDGVRKGRQGRVPHERERHLDGRRNAQAAARLLHGGRGARQGRRVCREMLFLPGWFVRTGMASGRKRAHQGRAGIHAQRKFDLYRIPAPVRVLPRNSAQAPPHHGPDGLPHRADPAAVPGAYYIRRDGRVRFAFCVHGLQVRGSVHG